MTWYVTVILIGLFVYHVTSYPGGAPSGACGTMIPSHYGVQPQSSASPFSVELSSYTYRPGDEITVTLKSAAGRLIKGFLIQMRYATGSQPTRVGSFTPITSGTHFACSGENGLTHARRLNLPTVTATWKAPDDVKEDLVLMATVVEDFSTFWVGFTSNILRHAMPTTQEPTTTPTTQEPTTTPTTPEPTTTPTTQESTTTPTTPEPTTAMPSTSAAPTSASLPTEASTHDSGTDTETPTMRPEDSTVTEATGGTSGDVTGPTEPPKVDDGNGTPTVFHLSHLRYSGLVLLTLCLLWL